MALEQPKQRSEWPPWLVLVCVFFMAITLGFLLPRPGHTPRSEESKTLEVLHDLQYADLSFRFDVPASRSIEWFPFYETNWIAELTGGTNALLNEHQTRYFFGKMKNGAPVDGWNRPLRAIAVTDPEGGLRLNFYSVGPDGISHSKGNDPDDINSWGTPGP